jgi:hypothetical protein
MKESPSFVARAVTLTGTLTLDGPADAVFYLFSPLGEMKWVDGWTPELLWPTGVDWTEGMVFRTRTGQLEEIWVISELDLKARRVVYYRTEPGRLIARIEVSCRPSMLVGRMSTPSIPTSG